MSELRPVIELEGAQVFAGDCRKVLRFLPDNSVDSIVTDPPYELGFMGKKWDSTGVAYDVELWRETLRVIKPGGHILAFGGSRTFHRLAVAIEDAGYEIRDTIAWISSKTFPKSLNVSKAIDKKLGVERETVGFSRGVTVASEDNKYGGINRGSVGIKQTGADIPVTVSTSEPGKKYEGWGTGLKQVVEPIVLARKPLNGTVAKNFLRWGVGGLNIDASRIGDEQVTINTFDNGAKPFGNAVGEAYTSRVSTGRWPANVVLDQDSAGILEMQATGVSKFFYVPTASKADRNEGLIEKNLHPTVKPTRLMQYLIKMITPQGGTVLDPFTGSGSTGKAAILDGFTFIGAELTAEYLPIIEQRLQWALQNREVGLF